jgi:hypothetical protein
MDVSVNVWVYVCMYACMYVCMYVYMYIRMCITSEWSRSMGVTSRTNYFIFFCVRDTLCTPHWQVLNNMLNLPPCWQGFFSNMHVRSGTCMFRMSNMEKFHVILLHPDSDTHIGCRMRMRMHVRKRARASTCWWRRWCRHVWYLRTKLEIQVPLCV